MIYVMLGGAVGGFAASSVQSGWSLAHWEFKQRENNQTSSSISDNQQLSYTSKMEPNEKSRSIKDNGTVSKYQDQFQENLEWEDWVTKIMNEMDKKY